MLPKYFTSRKRANGENYYTLTDDAPEILKSAVRNAHFGDLPNDWVYDVAAEAWQEATRHGLTSEDVPQYADGLVSVYTKEIYQWAADMCLTYTYSAAKDMAEDCGALTGDPEKQLRAIQYFATEAIVQAMVDAHVELAGSEGV